MVLNQCFLYEILARESGEGREVFFLNINATLQLCHYAITPLRHSVTTPLRPYATLPLCHYPTTPLRVGHRVQGALESLMKKKVHHGLGGPLDLYRPI